MTTRLICLLLILASTGLTIQKAYAQEGTQATRLAPELSKQAKIKTSSNPAEVLYAIEKSSFEADGSWHHQRYYSIRINSLEAARDYGRIVISFDHFYSDIDLEFANARSATGNITPVADDAVQHRITGGGQDFYSDSSELVFSLPNVVPGSIIEFQYTHTSKEIAFPGLYSSSSSPWYFQRKVGGDGWRGDFVKNYRYELSAPDNTELHFKYFNDFPKTPKTQKLNGKIVRTWQWNNVDEFHTEGWMPPFHKTASLLRVSTHKDWAAVDKWTWDKVADKLTPTPELTRIIKSFGLAKNASRQEKIHAVYQYMQSNIRYVFAHLGRGGYEPHFPGEVIKANYGDCKDQTVLSIALLRMLDVNALPALVETPNAGKSDTSLVNLIFDHMIVYIPEDEHGTSLYMDTTGDRALFPGVSNYLENQNTLIVDGKGGRFTKMQSDFSPSFAHLKIRYGLNANSQATANVDILLSGFFEQNMRSWWKNSNERESNLNAFLKGIFSTALDFELQGELHNAENIWQPVKIVADFTFNEIDDEQHSRGASFNQINYLFGSAGSLPLPQQRRFAFYDTTEYDLYMTVEMKSIDGLQPQAHTQGDNVTTNWFSLSQSGEQIDNTYKVNIHYHKNPLELEPAEYARYYAAFSQLSTRENWLIGYLPENNANKSTILAELKKQYGDTSFEYRLALAEQHIETGNFEAALEPAQLAVKQNSNSGKAWYILAMAQGFNSLTEESKTSFSKASSLGYAPW